jgi:hypothetical protein
MPQICPDRAGKKTGVHAKHVRNGVETLRVPTFEQNQEILQSTLTTFVCAQKTGL